MLCLRSHQFGWYCTESFLDHPNTKQCPIVADRSQGAKWEGFTRTASLPIIQHLTVWGVEPVVTHQTSWLESTGVCGVQPNQAGGNSARKRA